LFLNALNLKIVWWNVKNFFDTTDDTDKDDTILTKEQYETKLFQISQKLNYFKADIVGLCEVENINILKDIAKKTNYPFYYLEEGNDPRGIDVCILSKYILNYSTNKDMPTPYLENKSYKFSRDCPVVYLNIDNIELYILLTHLKSKLKDDDKSDKKRSAQVFGILDIISDIYNNSKNEPNLILMGDFNSYRYSEPMNILEKSGLVILNYFHKKNQIFTTKFNGKKEDIDYILFNKKMFEKSKINQFKVFNDKNYEAISDHFPIFLDFTL